MSNEYENERESDERVLDLREFVKLLLSKAVWIILCVALFAVAAGIYTKMFTKPYYKTTAVVYVNDGNMSSTSNVAVATYMAEDYAKTIMLPSVLEAAIDNLGIQMPYQELATKISVSLEKESRIVEITLTDTDPRRAQALCNEVCLASKARFEEKTSVERVSLYEEARLPAEPAGPSMAKNIALAAVIGFVLPCAIILVVYLLDDRIKTADDVLQGLKLSTLGDIPYRKD